MNMNVFTKMENPPRCSPPQTPLFAFYNRENTTMLFESGDEIEIFCQAGIRQGSGLTYTLHHNRINLPILSGTAGDLPANLFRIAVSTASLRPGFYDIKVHFHCGFDKIKFWPDGTEIPPEGICTFGWKINEMPLRNTRPADFGDFWKKALAEYREIPLDPRMESDVRRFTGTEIDEYNLNFAALPGNFDPDGCKFRSVLSYKISFAGPDGRRVYGWVARPEAEGRFPAMLVLPGAGNGKRPRPLDQARHGYAALDLQVHGNDVDADHYTPVPGYVDPPFVYLPKEKSRWHRIYLRAVRAVDFLAQMPEVDAKRIVAVGGSQGGRLSVVVAGLEPRVAAAVPAIAHGGNFLHLLQVCRCNAQRPTDFSPTDRFEPGTPVNGENLPDVPEMPDTDNVKCYIYYDPMNFAPDIRCPVYFNAGLIDPVSPAYATWAVFRQIASADKTFVPLAGLGHDWSASFDRSAYRWLETKWNPAELWCV